MQSKASRTSSDPASPAHPRAAARPRSRSFFAALALLTLAAGAAQAQTQTLIDQSLTVPVALQTITFEVTSAGGAQFIVGSGIFDSAIHGMGFLSGPNYSQAFSLTNGTINVDVFNFFVLPGPGEYSFSYTFVNANDTSGEQLAFAATVTELPPPPPPPTDPCASVACGSGATCDPSTAACACTDTTQTFCGSGCTDLTSDEQNCGACGNVCSTSFPFACIQGTCVPLPG